MTKEEFTKLVEELACLAKEDFTGKCDTGITIFNCSPSNYITLDLDKKIVATPTFAIDSHPYLFRIFLYLKEGRKYRAYLFYACRFDFTGKINSEIPTQVQQYIREHCFDNIAKNVCEIPGCRILNSKEIYDRTNINVVEFAYFDFEHLRLSRSSNKNKDADLVVYVMQQLEKHGCFSHTTQYDKHNTKTAVLLEGIYGSVTLRSAALSSSNRPQHMYLYIQENEKAYIDCFVAPNDNVTTSFTKTELEQILSVLCGIDQYCYIRGVKYWLKHPMGLYGHDDE